MAEYAAEHAYEGKWGLKQASAAANQPLPAELAVQLRNQGRIFIREGMRCKLSLRAEMQDEVNLYGIVYDQGLSDCLKDFLVDFVGLPCSKGGIVMYEHDFCHPELFYRDVGPLAATFLLPFCAAAGSRVLARCMYRLYYPNAPPQLPRASRRSCHSKLHLCPHRAQVTI